MDMIKNSDKEGDKHVAVSPLNTYQQHSCAVLQLLSREHFSSPKSAVHSLLSGSLSTPVSLPSN